MLLVNWHFQLRHVTMHSNTWMQSNNLKKKPYTLTVFQPTTGYVQIPFMQSDFMPAPHPQNPLYSCS